MDKFSPLATPFIQEWNWKREKPISKITPHIAREVNTAHALCAKYKVNPYHYYIGIDGDIVAGLNEDDLARVSSNEENDQNAVNILIANSDTNDGWPVSDPALNALIELCADIAKRHNLDLMYTGERTGSITCHDMFCRVECPGPFLKSKLREIGFIVYNKNHDLPFEPQREEGLFRVRRLRDDSRTQKGIFKSYREAVKKAKATGLNVYDANGIEVFNAKLSSDFTQWDNYDRIRPGDTVTSKEVLCYRAPGSNLCSLKIRGVWKTYVPALGGYMPNEYISMVHPEQGYRSGRTLFTLDEGVVEDVDEKANKVKVHGIWVCREFLLKKRNYG